MCTKGKKAVMIYKKKKQQWGYYSIAAYFILLHNLETDTQRMRMLIPIGTKQYKLANLSR